MQHIAAPTLCWSATRQVYELFAGQAGEPLPITVGGSAWFSWLDEVSSFAFHGQNGSYTARKENRPRGTAYWYAYRKTQGKLAKKYLGRTADLTMRRLEDVGWMLHADRAAQTPMPAPAPPTQPKPAHPLLTDGIGAQDAPVALRSTLEKQREPLNPLLAARLHLPRPRVQLVARAHLVKQLQAGLTGALTLVSAPAGFGKTTLLAQWLARSDTPVAWLSLEAEDNDPTRFLLYLIAALQRLDAQIGATALALLRTPQPPSPEVVLSILTSDLAEGGGGDVVLVLDDYHVITNDSVHRGMIFLLEHLPTRLHLILSTRADPPLPLARLRAQGQLSEVRAAELRFGSAETRIFLQTVMGLELPPDAIAALQRRTEGWIAGLQLAALSLQGRSDTAEFLAVFNGSHRFVLDYLSEEVLSRLPAPVMTFLLHTSIMEHLNGPSCDAVTGQEGSQAMLEALDRANLFVVPLDDERRWYRYHHLFAEVLRDRLQREQPALLPILHQRASLWCEQHSLPLEAVQHALLIPDAERAASLIERLAVPVALSGQPSTVLGWLNALPDALICRHPLLSVYHGGVLAFANQLEAAETRLQQAERSIQREISAEQERIIMSYVFIIRGDIALFSGDIARAVSLAHQAIEVRPDMEVILHVGALATAMRAYLVSGDVTPVTQHTIATADAFIRSSGNLFATVSSMTLRARLYVLQGRLRQAAASYAQVEQVIPLPKVLQTAYSSLLYYFGLADLLREWNDLDAAEQYLRQGMALIKEMLTLEPFVAVLGYIALARLHQARGNRGAAFEALDALAQLAELRRFPPHLMAHREAVRAQLELTQGNLTAAVHWADASGLSVTDADLPYPREAEYLALARTRIAQASDDPASPFLQDALHLLDRLLKDARAKARTGSVLEILVLQALALEVHGTRAGALASLERALVLAEPEGYVRLFVDEGEPMRALLRHAYMRGIVPGYVATLLTAFDEPQSSDLPLASARADLLLQPLTERERDVLRLLLEGASNRDIAHRLVLSVNTVKRHVYNLCGKLGVQSRAQAIVRARTLNLF